MPTLSQPAQAFLGQWPLNRAQVKSSLFTPQSFSILLSTFVFRSHFFVGGGGGFFFFFLLFMTVI